MSNPGVDRVDALLISPALGDPRLEAGLSSNVGLNLLLAEGLVLFFIPRLTRPQRTLVALHAGQVDWGVLLVLDPAPRIYAQDRSIQ